MENKKERKMSLGVNVLFFNYYKKNKINFYYNYFYYN